MQDELILVTGGAGFIGSHTVDRLIAEGCRVVVLDDLSTGKLENLAQYIDHPNLQIMEASIANGIFAPLARITARHGPIDRIIHLAAQVSVVNSLDNPLDDIRINYAGTVHVLEYARYSGVKKFVFASSSAVYSDDADLPVDEYADCAPISPYGIDKLGCEKYLQYYSVVHRLPSMALRFFNVYGPRQDASSAYSGVISLFADQASRGEPLTIYGDGLQTRDFVYVEDVARALVSACFSESEHFLAINIGTGVDTSILTLAEEIVALCESRSVIRHEATRLGEVQDSLAFTDTAERALAFQARVPLSEGLSRTVDWYRSSRPARGIAVGVANPEGRGERNEKYYRVRVNE